MDERYARALVAALQQKKPFKNIVSFSDERTDHRKAFYTSFALCELKSVTFQNSRNVSTIQVGRHYFKPLVNFNMVTQEELSAYDTEIILS
jgi:hypothetical protein